MPADAERSFTATITVRSEPPRLTSRYDGIEKKEQWVEAWSAAPGRIATVTCAGHADLERELVELANEVASSVGEL